MALTPLSSLPSLDLGGDEQSTHFSFSISENDRLDGKHRLSLIEPHHLSVNN